jgi:hypothetical protein
MRAQKYNILNLLWKIAVLGMEKPPVGAGTYCPSTMHSGVEECKKLSDFIIIFRSVFIRTFTVYHRIKTN